MVVCMIIAAIIAISSIFCFFASAVSNIGGILVPNMLQLMFGDSSTYQSYVVEWNRYGGLTFLFVLQIFIMLVATFCLFMVRYNERFKNGRIIGSIVLALLSLIAAIISLCTVKITNLDANIKLGVGPILYSSLQLLVVVLLVVGLVLYRLDSSAYSKKVILNNCDKQFSTNTGGKVLSETEKVDLIAKYKKLLDDEAITKEEFEKKKQEIL